MLMTRSRGVSPPGTGPMAVGVLERMDEAEWITAGVLHERYLKDVFHYVQRRVSRPEEAEDITAEVFAAAFAGLPRFRGHCPPRFDPPYFPPITKSTPAEDSMLLGHHDALAPCSSTEAWP